MNIIGEILKGRYEIIALLADGGMSSVYLSKDKNLGCYWAIKQVNSSNVVYMEAFKKEVELLSSLNHPDVPRIVDKIETQDSYFVVMDFIGGISLEKKVLSEGTQKEDDVVRWAKILCEVLNYLHNVKENPIVYRDMKPDNVMLTETGRVKLIDFGIAKECVRNRIQTGKKVGTRGYAAPEQYKDSILDEKTDIYSLGVTLYYLLTGKSPTYPPHELQPIRQINPVLSEGIEYIINKCTQLEPENRYQNCMELKYDLENINTLNSGYKRKMRKRLFTFLASVMCLIISLSSIAVGYSGKNNVKKDNYETLFNQAVTEKSKNSSKAINDFENAIKLYPNKVQAYDELFDVLLPSKSDKDYLNKTKNAITIMKNYIDNSNSSISKDLEFTELQYKVFKSCLEVNDTTFSTYALNLMNNKIKRSDAYKNGNFNDNEIDSYAIIAEYSSMDIGKLNFNSLDKELVNLENSTNNSKTLSADDKLNNYYILIRIYNTYPDKLKNSYQKIIDIGSSSKKILDTTNKVNFRYIIPMYQMIAESMYDKGMSTNDVGSKRTMLSNSILWFGYLDDLNADLSEQSQITKGDAYRNLFETYNNADESTNITEAVFQNLNKAETVYKKILNKNKTSFLAMLKLTETYVDMNNVRPSAEIKNNIQNTYKEVLKLKESSSDLDISSLSQFSTLKQQVQNMNLGSDKN